MTEKENLIYLLKQIHDEQPWHGDSLKKVLDGLTAEQAAARPIANCHTIWEITQHMINWRMYAIKNTAEDASWFVQPDSEKDWTTITDTSPANWERTLKELDAATNLLAANIENTSEEKLHEKLPDRPFTWFDLFHGVIYHDVCHSGQISILKKQLS